MRPRWSMDAIPETISAAQQQAVVRLRLSRFLEADMITHYQRLHIVFSLLCRYAHVHSARAITVPQDLYLP